MVNNLLEILIFGSTFLLGILLIANPLKVNKRANILFGFLNIIWATFWLEEIVEMTSISGGTTDNFQFLKPVQFLAPPLFYLSVKYFTNPEYKKFNPVIITLTLPYLLLLIAEFILNDRFVLYKVLLLLVYSFSCILLSLISLRRHKKHISEFSSDTTDINLNWLEYVIWFVMLLIIIVAIYNITYFEAPLNEYMNFVIYIIVILMSYYSLKQKEVFPLNTEERADVLSVLNDTSGTNQNKLMPDQRVVELKTILNQIITNEKLFLDSELNLSKLARRVNITSHQLSYVINNGFNQNFNSFINRYRVEEAKKLLKSRELDRYSIVGIAFESGFNSKTSFNTMFKRITGQTPSQYKKSDSDL